MYRLIFLNVFIFCSGLASADPETIKIHPDELSSYTHRVRFTSEKAIEALRIIDESLTSYRMMTEITGAEKPVILKRYKHTDWEMQNIGFANAITTIEGTIRQQRYSTAKLEYELVLEKNIKGRVVEVSKINMLKKEFQDAENEYRIFFEKCTNCRLTRIFSEYATR